MKNYKYQYDTHSYLVELAQLGYKADVNPIIDNHRKAFHLLGDNKEVIVQLEQEDFVVTLTYEPWHIVHKRTKKNYKKSKLSEVQWEKVKEHTLLHPEYYDIQKQPLLIHAFHQGKLLEEGELEITEFTSSPALTLFMYHQKLGAKHLGRKNLNEQGF